MTTFKAIQITCLNYLPNYLLDTVIALTFLPVASSLAFIFLQELLGKRRLIHRHIIWFSRNVVALGRPDRSLAGNI